MRKLLASFVALLVATIANAQAPAAAGKGPVEVNATGTPGKAAVTRTAQATATIKAIDVAARTVTLQARSGVAQTF